MLKLNRKDDEQNYGLRSQAEEYPMMLVLSFAYPCNALCPHCPYTNSNIRKEYKDAPFMDAKLFKITYLKTSNCWFLKRAVYINDYCCTFS